MAPGSDEALSARTNESRRPPEPRDPIPEHILQSRPIAPFELDKEVFMQNLRKARRVAAGGPSGMRSEHLRPLLDSEGDSNMFFEAAQSPNSGGNLGRSQGGPNDRPREARWRNSWDRGG